jgi:carbonic anhydrase/acetyltransferase-like protein (isoleucine patch superfamily)
VIIPYRGKWPKVHETAFVAPSADLIGDIEIGPQSSIWFQCVLRGDVGAIRVGSRSSLQDHTMVHSTRGLSTVTVGDDSTVGHQVTLHGCRIGSRTLVGMGAVILDNAEIGDECIVGAGALITKGMKVPPGSLVMGSPAKVVRELSIEERSGLVKNAANYVTYAAEYQREVRGPARAGSHLSDLDAMSEDEFDDAFPPASTPPGDESGERD